MYHSAAGRLVRHEFWWVWWRAAAWLGRGSRLVAAKGPVSWNAGVFANYQYAVAQREALARIIRNGRIKCGVADRDAR